MTDYDEKTSLLLSDPEMKIYYSRIGECIEGSLTVELMRRMPYFSEE